MSKIEKTLARFYGIPKDFTWDELVQVLNSKGYLEMGKGKTGGSRRKFSNALKQIISLHEPHPQKIVKEYALKQVIEALDAHKKNSETIPVETKADDIKKSKKDKKK